MQIRRKALLRSLARLPQATLLAAVFTFGSALRSDSQDFTDAGTCETSARNAAPYVFLYHTPYRFAWNPELHRTRASAENIWYDVRSWSFGAQ